MANIFCVGHTTLDNFLVVDKPDFKFGSKIPVKSVHSAIGGGAANVCVGVQKLGHKASIFTILGDDSVGKGVLKDFEKFGINTSFIKADKNPTDQSTIISHTSDRVIFTYSHPRDYDVPSSKIDHKYPYIFLSSIGGEGKDLYKDISELKKKDSNKKIFFNPGSTELRTYRDEVLSFLPVTDYLMVNLDEACTIVNEGLTRDQIEPFDLLNMLLEKGVKYAIVTDAENGVYVAYDKDEFHMESMPTSIEEKTGAGDAFASGFISGIMFGEDIKTSSRWGLANAAAVMKVIGAQNGLLDKKELTNFLRKVR